MKAMSSGKAWSGAAGGDRTHDPWLRRVKELMRMHTH